MKLSMPLTWSGETDKVWPGSSVRAAVSGPLSKLGASLVPVTVMVTVCVAVSPDGSVTVTS